MKKKKEKKEMNFKKIGNNVFWVIIGFSLCASGVMAANTLFASSEVTYDNTGSGATSETVQGALDELYGLASKGIYFGTTGDEYSKDVDVAIIFSGYGGSATYQYCISNTGSECTPNNVVTGNSKIISLTEVGSYKVCASVTANGATVTKCSEVYEIKPYEDGTPVYFNPETGQSCNDYTESQSSGTSNTGCLKWYIFNDSGSKDTVDMLLDHNIANFIKWNSSNASTAGPGTESGYLLDTLKTKTASWTGVPERSDSYIDPNQGYTIDYTGYRSRLIEANEVWEITKDTNGKANWDSGSGSPFHFEESRHTGQGTSKYPWLYDYTRSCTSYGCNVENSNAANGYWTGSAYTSYYSFDVRFDGSLYNFDVGTYGSYGRGVRPVITVSKSVIST